MEEKKVTIGDTTLILPSPFIVFATQNPLEHEGTYPLPEAQLDRFLMRIVLSYPSREDEKQIWLAGCGSTASEVIKKEPTEKRKTEDLIEMIDYIARSVQVDELIYDYVSAIISATRDLTKIGDTSGIFHFESCILSYGASTRA